MDAVQTNAIISLIPYLEMHEIDLLNTWLTNEDELEFPQTTSHIFDAIISLTHLTDWNELVKSVHPVCIANKTKI